MSNVETGTLVPYLTEMFRFQAWMAMGKVASPMSGKIERELKVARQMIDLLAELETRTEGNRSDDETLMLQGALTELRLNYLEEAKKPDPKPEEDAEEVPEVAPTEAPDGASVDESTERAVPSSEEDAKEME